MTADISLPPDGKQFQLLRAAIDIVAKLIVSASALAIVALISVQVAARYLADTQILGLDELSVMVVLWLWFFGAVLAVNSGFYITGGIPMSGHRSQRIVAFASALFGFAVTAVFGYLLFEYCRWTMMREVRSVALSVPVIFSVIGPFVALVGIAVISLIDLTSALYRSPEEDPE